MSRVFVHGVGAVSPAGWNHSRLCAALDQGHPLPVVPMDRPGRPRPLWVRTVPPPDPRPAFLGHPRVRRAGVITHYLVGAALEARGVGAGAQEPGGERLGVVVCVMSGCVSYSRRFFEEVLEAPGTASPLLFPETVFNAPASHAAALLGATHDVMTLVGDEGAFLQGLATGAGWLEEGRLDGCVVVGIEEMDWLIADAMRLFSRRRVHAAGAGALYLRADPAPSRSIELTGITDSHPFSDRPSRRRAAERMRRQLPRGGPGHLLVWGVQGIAEDRDEQAAWRDWAGTRLSPKPILGEAFAASTAWHCIAACDALQRGACDTAVVSVVGTNQQAVGASFARLAGETG